MPGHGDCILLSVQREAAEDSLVGGENMRDPCFMKINARIVYNLGWRLPMGR